MQGRHASVIGGDRLSNPYTCMFFTTHKINAILKIKREALKSHLFFILNEILKDHLSNTMSH